MRTRIVTILSVMSLVLCLATVVLWVRSYWAADYLCYQDRPIGGRRRTIATHSIKGFLFYNRTFPAVQPDASASVEASKWRFEVTPASRFLDPAGGVRGAGNYYFGFGYWRGERVEFRHLATGLMEIVAVIPHWFLALIFAAIPTRWLAVRRRADRRSERELCRDCGYDLRATPDRCPECGAIAKAADGEVTAHNPHYEGLLVKR
jgi:hypothetical protein